MKTLIPAAIRCSLMFTAVAASLFSVQPAQAYTVTLQQVGSNVVANGSGAINLTGLTFFEIYTVEAGVGGFFGIIETGPLQATSRPLRRTHRTDEFRARGRSPRPMLAVEILSAFGPLI